MSEVQRREREIAIAKAKARAKANQTPRTLSQTLYENIIGQGEVDTVGERIGEAINQAGVGSVRGVKTLLDLPELAGSLGRLGFDYFAGNELKPLPKETLLGGTFEKGARGLTSLLGSPDALDAKPTTTTGEFARTIGEFVTPAGVVSKFAKPIITAAGVSAVGSETAGQATKDTVFEPYARVAGALVAPYGFNKTLQALNMQSVKKPTLENLKAEKNKAYELVKTSAEKFEQSELDELVRNINRQANIDFFDPTIDEKTKKAIKLVENLRGKDIFIGEIDKVRKRLSKLYKGADDEDAAILGIINTLDDFVATKAKSSDLINAARAANAKFSKANLLEKEFVKASDQIASTGSGGNVVNKYRQTLTRIKNNPMKAKFFTKDELEQMDRIINGDFGVNTLRLIGKLSPSGNGLMLALNIGAIAYNPSLAGITAVGVGSKALSEKATMQAVEKLQDLVKSGGIKLSNDEAKGLIREFIETSTSRVAGITSSLSEDSGQNVSATATPTNSQNLSSIFNNLSNINLPTNLSPSLLR